MTRQLLVLIVGTLALVPYAMKAQEPTPKKAAQPKSNQVYVKIIMPTDPADRDKDRPVVESWIAEGSQETRAGQVHRRDRVGASGSFPLWRNGRVGWGTGR